MIDPASPTDQQHFWSRGTSFSAPQAAGAAALLYTWFKNNNAGVAPTPALLKAMQITLARDLSGTGHPPDARQGWGKADLERAFATDGRYSWNNEGTNTLLASPGQVAYLPTGAGSTYRIKDVTKPVRVTVVWTDAPGNPATSIALVNDLDLTVRMRGSGAGRYALGNDFNPSTGRSNVRTVGGAYDSVNNVEQVVFNYSDAGADHFSVEIFARTIASDGINVWSPVTNQQNFAMFIENAVPNINAATFLGQTGSTTSAAGANYVGSVMMRNDGDTPWTEGPNNFYRLASVGADSPFGPRLYLNAGEVIRTGESKTFAINTNAPYAAGSYTSQWQMVEETGQLFGQASPSTQITVTPSPYSLFTLTPCRVLDTRDPIGPYGGPALSSQTPRVFLIRGRCGVPNGATAVSVNVTVVAPAGVGFATLFPSNVRVPVTSTMTYKDGVTRANSALVSLDAAGQLSILSSQDAITVVLDVNGYFQ